MNCNFFQILLLGHITGSAVGTDAWTPNMENSLTCSCTCARRLRGGSIFNWLAGAATDRSCDPPVATGSCQNQTGSCQSGTGRSRDLPGWQLQAAAVDCDYNATARKYTIFYESVFLDDWRLNFLPPIKAVKWTCMQWQKLWRYYDLCYVITIVMQ